MIDPLKIVRKEGKSGSWQVKAIVVSDNDAKLDFIRCLCKGHAHRAVLAGKYWTLTFKGEVIMSNTPAEINDHRELFKNAHGRVLITGLGLGMAAEVVASKPEVESVTVIEKSKDVVKLIRSFMPGRVQVIIGDAFDVPLPDKTLPFDYAWHDIWPTISEDNLPEMRKLKRAYSHLAKKQGFWSLNEFRR